MISANLIERRCLICDQTATRRLHHPTGRRWDPDIIVPLCHDHHMLVHDDWHRAEVGPKLVPETWLHAIAISARRWALLCSRLHREQVLCALTGPLADWFDMHAIRLEAMAYALDLLGDAWRQLAVFIRPAAEVE